MSSDPTSQPPAGTAIDDAAQDWFLKLRTGASTAADQVAFAAWLNADARHRRAFEDIRLLWDDAAGLEAAFRPRDTVIPLPARPKRPARRLVLAGALAACLALLVIGGLGDLDVLLRADHATAAGQQATVTLPDGSRAHLNTDTAIALDFAGTTRRVTLLKGEAWFDVAKDPGRPFEVTAQDGRSRALGTAYAVRDAGGGAQVTVTEGTVRVTAAGSEVTLKAGDRVSYRRGRAPGAVERAATDQVLAWRQGMIVMEGLPFAAAVAEIDRYKPGRILVLADTAKLQPVTARVAIGSLDGGIRALAATHGLSATRVTAYLTVLR